jgi:hypothetical protein
MHTSLPKLLARQIFGNNDNDNEEEEDSCRSYSEDTNADPLTGSTTLHDLLIYLTAASMAVCIISSTIVITAHFRKYYQPRAQKQNIRMILTMPIFTIFCFFSVLNYRLEPYFTPLIEFYEVFGLVAAFYLLLAILTPDATTWAEQLAWFSEPSNGGYKAFRRSYICVVQVIPGFFITTIVSMIIAGASCYGGDSYRRASTAITVINLIQLITAIQSMIRFLRKWSKTLQANDPRIMTKLLSFKLIVGIEIIQHLIWNILIQTDTLTPTSTMSYNDLHYGIMSTALSLEAMIFGLFMLFTFWPEQNRRLHQQHIYASVEAGKADQSALDMSKHRVNPLKAVWDVVNLMDIVASILRAGKLLVGGRNGPRRGGAGGASGGGAGGRRWGKGRGRRQGGEAQQQQTPPSYEQMRPLANAEAQPMPEEGQGRN